MEPATTVFWITGPPASGKSTLCGALAKQFEKAVHIPVDDIREWVVSGMAGSVPWTDETDRQFVIAEAAVCEMARCYAEAGFNVLIDHCRNMPRLEAAIRERLKGVNVCKVCLMPDLETNLHRSHTRTNKEFDPHMMDETIVWTNEHYRLDVLPEWILIDNTRLSVEDTVAQVLEQRRRSHADSADIPE
jgi:adenylylsulfate kinase-like enzyme